MSARPTHTGEVAAGCTAALSGLLTCLFSTSSGALDFGKKGVASSEGRIYNPSHNSQPLALVQFFSFVYQNISRDWGGGSVGKELALQAEGPEFGT